MRTVGRLDYMTEGLLLLTNNGALKRFLELPINAFQREYLVRLHAAHAPISRESLADLAMGITVKGISYGPIGASLVDPRDHFTGPLPTGSGGETQGGGRNNWATVTLHEGKNREIRRVMEHKGWQVTRLIRIAYGPLRLGTLSSGNVLLCSSEQVSCLTNLMAKVEAGRGGVREDGERMGSGRGGRHEW